MGRPPVLAARDGLAPPPNIIRTCCSFGADLSVARIPFMKKTDIISVEQLGQHQYLSGKFEGNGIVYTARGGFIDVGHLRDYADWTGYLYLRMLTAQQSGEGIVLDLGSEGGHKTLSIFDELPADKALLSELAGKIAFDLSLWHEIATWFGSSYIPLVPERYSSFSPEDLYSNLLGVKIGMEAIQSDLPYEVAVTQLLLQHLHQLKVVGSAECTLEAMESVEEIWWTKKKALPNGRVLLRRNVAANSYLVPWLVPQNGLAIAPTLLPLPSDSLDQYFTFVVKTNMKTALRKMDPANTEQYIDQTDFPFILDFIENEQFVYNQPHRRRAQKVN